MPIFGEINSFKNCAIFVIVASLGFTGLIFIGFTICSLCGINQIIGIIFGMMFGIALLWFVYDQKGYELLSSEKRYHFKKL